MKAKKNLIYSLLFGAAMALSAGAHASLELVGAIDETGTGLGAVNTVLTLQAQPSNLGAETGSVAWNGTDDVITGDAKIGASQTLTRTFEELLLTQATDLQIVFNTNEPNPNQTINEITLTDLVLTVYDPSGTLLFTSGSLTGAPLTLAGTELGIGQSGYLFALDSTQAAQLQAAAFGANFDLLNRIGLDATIANATGGPDTFFAVAVPEPETYAMMLAGLGLMGFVARRRERSIKAA